MIIVRSDWEPLSPEVAEAACAFCHDVHAILHGKLADHAGPEAVLDMVTPAMWKKYCEKWESVKPEAANSTANGALYGKTKTAEDYKAITEADKLEETMRKMSMAFMYM